MLYRKVRLYSMVGCPPVKYIVIDILDNEILTNFSATTDTIFFNSIKSCKEAIKDDMDEPEGEDLDTGEILTKENDGWSSENYHIYQVKRVT